MAADAEPPPDDAAWLAALPAGAEFLTPAGGGYGAGGLRCRVTPPGWAAEYPDHPPPPGTAPVEIWAGGLGCVPVAELRTWERFR